MTILQYIPVAALAQVLLYGAITKFPVPYPPFAIFLLFGQILILLQLEDHKILNAIHNVMDAYRDNTHHHQHVH